MSGPEDTDVSMSCVNVCPFIDAYDQDGGLFII